MLFQLFYSVEDCTTSLTKIAVKGQMLLEPDPGLAILLAHLANKLTGPAVVVQFMLLKGRRISQRFSANITIDNAGR